MILQLAVWSLVAVGLGLAAVSLLMLLAPRKALAVLAVMGSTSRVHFGEMAVRSAAGLALVVGGPFSKLPLTLPVVGWFLLVSAAIIAVLPRRWHSAFSKWWAGRIPPWAFKLSGLAGLAAAAAVIWAVR